jgi:hypothetical protein
MEKAASSLLTTASEFPLFIETMHKLIGNAQCTWPKAEGWSLAQFHRSTSIGAHGNTGNHPFLEIM